MFLELESSNNGKANIVIDDNGFKNLIVNQMSNLIYHFHFKPIAGGTEVKAVMNQGSAMFTTSDSKRFQLVAELKHAHYQRLANQLATQISRVGLTESEWLRRSHS